MKTYVTYYLPMAERKTIAVSSRDPNAAARKAPPEAFGFEFFSTKRALQWSIFTKRLEPLDVSGSYFINGERMSFEEALDREDCEADFLFDKVAYLWGWDGIVRSRDGNYIPFMLGDAIINI